MTSWFIIQFAKQTKNYVRKRIPSILIPIDLITFNKHDLSENFLKKRPKQHHSLDLLNKRFSQCLSVIQTKKIEFRVLCSIILRK